MEGIEVSDETLAIDVIASVGHEGTFLSEMHTVEHLRKELWFSELLDRQFWQAWRESGTKDMMSRCIEKKNDILKSHVPKPLNRETEKDIDKILQSARRNLSG